MIKLSPNTIISKISHTPNKNCHLRISDNTTVSYAYYIISKFQDYYFSNILSENVKNHIFDNYYMGIMDLQLLIHDTFYRHVIDLIDLNNY